MIINSIKSVLKVMHADIQYTCTLMPKCMYLHNISQQLITSNLVNLQKFLYNYNYTFAYNKQTFIAAFTYIGKILYLDKLIYWQLNCFLA